MAEILRNEIATEGVAGGKVWLIGGTSESAELAVTLAAQGIPFVVTVTTETARQLYAETTQVVIGTLTLTQMAKFVRQQDVVCIVDASHPFARVVSEGAIAIATQRVSATGPIEKPIDWPVENTTEKETAVSLSREIAYLRYERNQILPDNQSPVSIDTSLKTLLNCPQLHHQRILFTLGYQSLLTYTDELSRLRQKSKLFARILPSQVAISAALAAGFSSKEIVALRPPISLALEKALWQQWAISMVVAKASGHAGGEAIKRQVAAELGVHLRLLERPPITYPLQTSCVSDVISFCKAQLLRCHYSNE
ncbi:MAG: precorrin-6A/cobalt-precorrin-6A reductase [Phormidesmis sp.]